MRRDYCRTEDDEVYKGISRKAHPHWLGWRSVDDAKKAVGESPRAIIHYLDRDFTMAPKVKNFYRKNPNPTE